MTNRKQKKGRQKSDSFKTLMKTYITRQVRLNKVFIYYYLFYTKFTLNYKIYIERHQHNNIDFLKSINFPKLQN